MSDPYGDQPDDNGPVFDTRPKVTLQSVTEKLGIVGPPDVKQSFQILAELSKQLREDEARQEGVTK